MTYKSMTDYHRRHLYICNAIFSEAFLLKCYNSRNAPAFFIHHLARAEYKDMNNPYVQKCCVTSHSYKQTEIKKYVRTWL